jgi:hypothetical protein
MWPRAGGQPAATAGERRCPVFAEQRRSSRWGDSYISGEAGRWEGNSNAQFASRDGTDRAYTGGCCSYDTSRVYLGGSDDKAATLRRGGDPLPLLWSSSPGRYACRNTPGQFYDAMTLAPS